MLKFNFFKCLQTWNLMDTKGLGRYTMQKKIDSTLEKHTITWSSFDI